MANTQSNIIYCSCRSIRDQYNLCSGPDNVNSEAVFDGAACYLSVVGRAYSSAYQEHVQISALSSYKVRYPQQFACAHGALLTQCIILKCIFTSQLKSKYVKFRQQIRLRMHTFACYATYLTALFTTTITTTIITKNNLFFERLVYLSVYLPLGKVVRQATLPLHYTYLIISSTRRELIS